LSTYGLSKVLGEQTIKFFCSVNNIKGVILRIPGIFGGTRSSGYIYNTALKCLKNESVTLNTTGLGYWETINIDDLSNYIAEFIRNYDWNKKVETFNIAYGSATDFIECAYKIKKILNSSSEIIEESYKGYRDFCLDNSKVQKYVNIKEDINSSLERYVKKIRI
ncbi:MAG: NAD-dependent epimerase/dehydratase family protein, partial [Bacteroidetes bacterium]|nr:NAD-dependent epimerase/dehydratase family protein [Bacteroidota bacterium]